MKDLSDNALLNSQSMISDLQAKVRHLEEQLAKASINNNDTHEKTSEHNSGRVQTRMTKSSGKDIAATEGRIGGEFKLQEDPEFLKYRLEYFETLYEIQQRKIEEKDKEAIKITLPDGKVVDGKAWETSPLDIAMDISEGLAKASVIAKIQYTRRISEKVELGGKQDGFDDADGNEVVTGELWDMSRPLEGDCKLQLLKFDDDEAKMVFWHSAAHLIGETLECKLGAHLTVGPPVDPGFYYDSYIGEHGITEAKLKELEKYTLKTAKQKQVFQRLVMTKEEALKMFAYNPYKVSIIKNKVAEGGLTSCYRNGPFIDLCLGPHIVHTGSIKALQLKQATNAYWLGNEENDRLQRVRGVAFPDKKLLKEHKALLKIAAENDHRKRGLEQELFFFDPLSPGSCFWQPHGAKIFNTLVSWIQEKNRKAGYQEVITPNVYSVDLWKISGHWEHYQKNMFTFTDGEHENSLYALKPMNCPGHCVIFDSSVRSYRDLPLRLSDFGVLHRNEASGALSGLTRVRRFQQDDAHIFCRKDQVRTEVLNTLTLIKNIYDTLGLRMMVGRSTRPAKAVGLKKENGEPDPAGIKLWDDAEEQLSQALNDFVGPGNWKDNPGDGAFYGPKIDIEVLDALKRKHQCATVQLDFQTPQRFNLKYTGNVNVEGQSSMEQPVMIHRAILGSLERMIGILTEHFIGKWPFWMSPRQVMIIPVAGALNDYAQELCDKLFREGYNVEVDLSTKTLNKKILLAQREQFNFMFVVGDAERQNETVNVRSRRNNKLGEIKFYEILSMFKKYKEEKFLDDVIDPIPEVKSK